MITYEDLLDSLGGSYVLGAEGMEYGDWSPNKLKTLVVLPNGIYVEYHVGKSKVFRPKKRKDASSRSPLRVLSHKQFGCLETILTHSSFLENVNLQRFFPAQTRLSQIISIDGDVDVELIARAASGERNQFKTEHPNLKGDPRPLYSLGFFQSFASQLAPNILKIKDIDEMVAAHPLVPQTYSADKIDESLHTFLTLVDNSKKPQSQGIEDYSEDETTDQVDSVSSYDSTILRSILTVLKQSAQAPEPFRTSLLRALSANCSPDLKSDPPKWFPLVSGFPEFGSLFTPQSHSGPLLHGNDESASVSLFLRSIPQDVRDALGYSTVASATSATLSEIAHRVSTNLDDLDEDLGEDFDDSEDLDEDFDDDSEDSEDLDDSEDEISIIDDEPDDEHSEALEYFAGSVSGTVLSILEEYDKIFASGYEVLSPVGILSSNPDRGNLGVTLALSSDGRVYKKPVNPVVSQLWSLAQESLNLVPVDVRSISEIAKILVTGEDSKGNSYSGNLYFPYKMLEYAFGRRANTGERDLYPKHSSASSWSAYKTQEVEQSLTDIFSMVVKTVIEQFNYEESFYTPECKAVVDQYVSRLKDALTRCVMLSTFEVMKNLPVKMKARVLFSSDDPRLFSTNIVKQAIVNSSNTDGGRKSKSFDVEHSGGFWEFKHETDAQLANVEPLFSYKLLESLQHQGKSISSKSTILGMFEDDSIAISDKGGIQLHKHTSHGVVGGSRSGKGLVTQNILASHLADLKPLALMDNKPDMASLILSINPNAFVVNGSNIAHNPEQGTDIFSQFTSSHIRNWESQANIPDYLMKMKGFSPNYVGTLGTISYMRGATLMLGILAARTLQGMDAVLGGPKGITVVFDEITNTAMQLNTFLYGAALSTHLLPAKYMSEYRDWVEAGKGDKKRPSESASEEDFWFTSFYLSIKESLQQLFTLRNAGFKNEEALRSDVFMIGQEPIRPIASSGEIDDLLPKQNKVAKGVRAPSGQPQLLSSLGAIGALDVFIGYNVDQSQILNQNPQTGGYSRDKLDDKARNFAYLPNFDRPLQEKAWGGDEATARKAVYFKPALLFADGDPDHYCWQNSVEYMRRAGLEDIDGVISRNSDASGNLHKGVGFKGYLEQAGVSVEQAAQTLQVTSDMADMVVKKMGYPGTWREFTLDLRPDWIFSVRDVYQAFASDSYQSDLTSDFREVFPEAFSTATGSSPDMSGVSFDLLDSEDEDEGGCQIPNRDFDTSDDSDEDDYPESPSSGGDPFRGQTFSPQQPPFQQYNPEVMTGSPLPSGGFRLDGPAPRQLAAPVVMNPESVQQALLADLRAFIGSPANVKTLSVQGSTLIINRSAYRTKVGSDWSSNTQVPPYLMDALRSSNVAPIIPWRILATMQNLTHLSFDSWEFVMGYVLPDLGWGRSFDLSRFFSTFRKLSVITIGSDTYTFEDYKEHNGVPTGVQRVDQMRSATMVCSRFLSKMTKSSWDFATDSWKRDDIGGLGKTWRISAALTGAAVAGTANLASKTTRGVLGFLGGALSSFKDSVREVNGNQ